MKHAVVLAHPKINSFNGTLARACVDSLVGLGHEVILRDLYAMGFDPCLRASELPTVKGYQADPDAMAERALLKDVDSVIFVYPFWFNSPPAMLKGYVERIFSMGFGYAPGPAGPEALLEDKTLFSISTSGAPEEWVASTGALAAVKALVDTHLARVCGLRVVDHLHFGGITTMITEESVGDMCKTATDAITAAFGDLNPV